MNLSENAKQFSLSFSYTDDSGGTFFAFLCSFGITHKKNSIFADNFHSYACV